MRAAQTLFAVLALTTACSAPAAPADVADVSNAGDAAATDDTPPLPPLPVTELEHVAACARIGACVPEGSQPLSVCASSYVYFLADSQLVEVAALVRCVNAAGTDCARIRACTNLGEAPTPCDPAATPPRCDGDVARICRARTGLTYATDCAALGRRCSLDALGNAVCGLGSCTVGTPDACDGNRLMQCIDGVLNYSDCGRAGLRCLWMVATPGVPDPEGSAARCAGRGELCDPALRATTCANDVLAGCFGGRTAMVDCRGVLPTYTCIAVAGEPPRCGRTAQPTCAADPINGTDYAEGCEGSAIRYCLDGAETQLDCASLGFASCALDARGAPRCAP